MKTFFCQITFSLILITGVTAQNLIPPVGIGTTTPISEIHVKSALRYPRIFVQSTDPTGAPGYGITETTGTEAWTWHYDLGGGFMGFYRGSAGNKLVIKNNGYVGINTVLPESILHVVGESRFNGSGWFARNNNGNEALAFSFGQNYEWDIPSVKVSVSDNGTNRVRWYSTRYGHVVTFQRESPIGVKNMMELGGSEGGGHYLTMYSDNGSTPQVVFHADGNSYIQGNLSIGSNDSKGYKFAVNGDALFTKVKVKGFNSWPDYVFQKSYRLPSLKELEQFIQLNKHLPGVPSANEVEKDGLDMGESQAVLLKKIEELTLYIIELNKRILELEKQSKN